MAKEMRPLFEQEYGELLSPHGFFLFKHTFYRVDFKMQMIWFVSLYLGTSGETCTFRYSVWPFCRVTSKSSFREGGMQIETHLKRWKDRFEFGKLARLDFQYNLFSQIFKTDILDKFVGIADLNDYRSFRKWHWILSGGDPAFELWLKDSVWEFIQLGMYHEAEESLQAAFDRWVRNRNIDIDKLRVDDGNSFNKEILLDYETLLQLFNDQNYDQLRRLLEQRIENTKSACFEFFGKRLASIVSK